VQRRFFCCLCISALTALAAGCPDRGLDPAEYCSEQISDTSNQTCQINYSACSDNFSCDFEVDCVASGSSSMCHCRAAPNCHIDVTFETSKVCGAASDSNHARLRELIVAGCKLGGDTQFSRIR
jgi:hypothetical protein